MSRGLHEVRVCCRDLEEGVLGRGAVSAKVLREEYAQRQDDPGWEEASGRR